MAKTTENAAPANNAADANAPAPKADAPKVYIAGYKEIVTQRLNKKTGEMEDQTSIAIILKDVVSKNVWKKAKATRTGTTFAAPGLTVDHLLRIAPLGSVVPDATWGEEIPSQYGGIYKIEGLD